MYNTDITQELGQNFLAYAAAVNSDRAIPDAKTGLKPVARRILYTMENEGFKSNKPHRKSAKTVGSVMGRFHPHGDSSIYEASVRLSQSWVMRYPLIGWHGNNGNISGDGAAAMRYTESRLMPISEDGLLANLKKKNVPFVPNYSEEEEEPVTLPALFPNLLCNPNQGIGVALACSWLPHNLTEVGGAILQYLADDSVDVTTLISGPDFPLGGTIINGSDLKNIYATGKGRAILRADYVVETRGAKELLVFTDVPFGTNTENLLNQINKACTDEKIDGISEVRDESNKKALRIVVELRKGVAAETVAKKLYKETDLQKSISANQVALVDGKPTLLNLKEYFEVYTAHNMDVIKNEALFDQAKALARQEIVSGLVKALEDIDNIIVLIKQSKNTADARAQLIAKYAFTENQAKAIVDMKLGKLSSIEKVELNNEAIELAKSLEVYGALINDDAVRKQELVERLTAFIGKFGDERRSTIVNIEIKPEEKEIAEVVPVDVVVTFTHNGEIKKVPANTFKLQKKNGVGAKNKGAATATTISTNTIDTLMIFTDRGLMYRLVVDEVPTGTNASAGTPIASLIAMEAGEKVIALSSLGRRESFKYVTFFTKNGLIKKTDLSEYVKTKRKAGIAAIKIKDGDSLANVLFMNDEDCVVVTRNGMSIHFDSTTVNATGRATTGMKAIKLGEGDEVLCGVAATEGTSLVILSRDGRIKRCDFSIFPMQAKAGKGVIAYKGEVAGAVAAETNSNVLVSSATSTICIATSEVPSEGRTALGVNAIKGGNATSLVAIRSGVDKC